MRNRFRIVLLLLGWTLATGAHWDVIQVAAWGRMWARFAQVQPAAIALATTFSPEAMCSVCRTVQAAKHQQEENTLTGVSLEKAPLLLPVLRAIIVEPPVAPSSIAGDETLAPPSMREAPPVPPPRLA